MIYLILHDQFLWWMTKNKQPPGVLGARNGHLMTKWPLKWQKIVFEFVCILIKMC